MELNKVCLFVSNLFVIYHSEYITVSMLMVRANLTVSKYNTSCQDEPFQYASVQLRKFKLCKYS